MLTKFTIPSILLAASCAYAAVGIAPNHLHGRQFDRCSNFVIRRNIFQHDELPIKKGSLRVRIDRADPGKHLRQWDRTQDTKTCHVKVSFVPDDKDSTTDNVVTFALYLPSKSDWNDRLITVGSDMFDGGMAYDAMFQYMAHGYAAVSTDMGHDEKGPDALDGMGEHDTQVDWAWRAMKYSVPMAKDVVKVFYDLDDDAEDEKELRSYYSGCGMGGRQGLRHLQEDVDAFDGLLIGAPAWDVNNFMTWATYIQSLAPQTNFTQDNANRLFSVITEVCEFDTETDTIARPTACESRFRDKRTQWLEALCENDQQTGCFDGQKELNTAVLRMDDIDVPGGDSLMREGLDITAAPNWDAWNAQPFADLAKKFSNAMFGEEISWSGDGQEYFKAMQKWHDKSDMKPSVDPSSDAIQNFKGKVIMYHGLKDGVMPAGATHRFYNEAKWSDRTENFKYYEIPGLEHCFNKDVKQFPWYVGGVGLPPVGADKALPFIPKDKDDMFGDGTDAMEALTAWVEDGREPGDLEAVGFDPVTLEVEKREKISPTDKDRR